MQEQFRQKPRATSYEVTRDGPDILDSGDLVRVVGESERLSKTKYRLLGVIDHADGTATAWIGPPTLTPRDIERFAHEFEMGHARQGKFKGSVPVDAQRLRKVLDS